MSGIKKLVQAVALGCAAVVAAAQSQAPVEDRSGREQAIQRGQLKAGTAYREMQQAQYEMKLAEQDVLNLQESYRAARKQADELKQQLDAATRAHAEAKAKEARARKAYEEALGAVDQAFGKPPAR